MSTKADRKKKNLFLIGVVIFVLGIVLATIASVVIDKAPKAVSMWAVEDSLEDPDDFNKTQIVRSMGKYSFIGIDEGAFIKNEFRSASNVTIKYIDTKYNDIYDIKMNRGRWMMPEDAGIMGAVIDEGLALKLFGSYDCIGEEFEYLEDSYTVVGLSKGIGAMVSRADHTVYLMYDEMRPVDYFGIAGSPAVSAFYAYKVLLQTAAKNFKHHTVYDNMMLKHKSLLTVKMLLLPILIIIFVAIYKLIKKWTLKKIHSFKEVLVQYYVRDKLISIILHILLWLLMVAAWLVLIWLTYSFITKSLFYLEQFVPSSLVDIKAILSTIKVSTFLSNSSDVYKPFDVLYIYWADKMLMWSFGLFYLGGVMMILGRAADRFTIVKRIFA